MLISLLIGCKITSWKERLKIEQNGRRRPTLDCIAIEDVAEYLYQAGKEG
jgi:hypothetical protein